MPSAWVAHVKKYYSGRRKKDPKYKYSSAMKDARATYKKADAKSEGPKSKASKPKSKPKRKAKRKRPGVPKDFTNLN